MPEGKVPEWDVEQYAIGEGSRGKSIYVLNII